jgi:hypothetical protein
MVEPAMVGSAGVAVAVSELIHDTVVVEAVTGSTLSPTSPDSTVTPALATTLHGLRMSCVARMSVPTR